MDLMFTTGYEKDYLNTYYTPIVDFNAACGYLHTDEPYRGKNLHTE